MAIKIKRFNRRLFEDDANNQQTTLAAPAQPATTGTQPVLPDANAQPQLAQPTNGTQPAPAQPQNLQQPQQNQLANPTQQAVIELLKSMENTYWCIANNVPEMIQAKLPDFKSENAEAKPIIDLWEAFKKNPNENTFKAFIEGFGKFGSQPDNTQNQQQQLQNVNASIQYNFKRALHENLKKANFQKQLDYSIKNYL